MNESGGNGHAAGLIRRFEDLVAWQLAREVAQKIFSLTRDGSMSHDFALVDQMRRSAVSIMSNLAEGFERETQADRLRFYLIAKGLCAELRAQLDVALDAGYLTQTAFAALQAKAERVARIIGGLRSSIRRSPRVAQPSRSLGHV